MSTVIPFPDRRQSRSPLAAAWSAFGAQRRAAADILILPVVRIERDQMTPRPPQPAPATGRDRRV